ncbi:MAG: cytochrome c biogenesis protein CcdA [Candidatus Electryonea clarkiae]|nr:cytochrome c biogenesis protein CcdA [Candidatus Electryonea clarkiae]MDP8286239.1 cytochrome c biogenesis protein CcdA [Candidatus Electryonea clarkiae]
MENLLETVQGNPILALGAVFVGGLLSASSPCVLAILPLVIGYVGGASGGDQRKSVIYSLFFALGLAITFTILGAIAAIFGRLFGQVGQAWYWIVGALVIAMGLSMMGLFEVRIPMPQKFQPKTRGALGAFMLGMLFGIASSPCATPVLIVILTFVASQGKVLYGTLLLFVYAIGHVALIVVAGISAGFVQKLVESKGAMNLSVWTKKVFGALVTFAGVYIIYVNVLP